MFIITGITQKTKTKSQTAVSETRMRPDRETKLALTRCDSYTQAANVSSPQCLSGFLNKNESSI